jgi:hypothetical protein
VTREISDIRETGSYYYRRKKRNEKNYDEKELLYIAELIKLLPRYQMVGILEIIEEKPFSEINTVNYQFDLNTLRYKKVREIEFYVKKKLANHYRAKEKTLNKLKAQKRAEKERVKEEEREKEGEGEAPKEEEKGGAVR